MLWAEVKESLQNFTCTHCSSKSKCEITTTLQLSNRWNFQCGSLHALSISMLLSWVSLKMLCGKHRLCINITTVYSVASVQAERQMDGWIDRDSERWPWGKNKLRIPSILLPVRFDRQLITSVMSINIKNPKYWGLWSNSHFNLRARVEL